MIQTNITFEEVMENLNKELLKTPPYNYLMKFKNLHKIAIKTFPQEFFNFLQMAGFSRELVLLQNNAGELFNEIDSYSVDMDKKTIKVSKGSASLEEPICDLVAMIKNNKDIVENTWQWNLVGSYLSDVNNFAMIQAAKAIILQENK